jgi:hypothetical protein
VGVEVNAPRLVGASASSADVRLDASVIVRFDWRQFEVVAPRRGEAFELIAGFRPVDRWKTFDAGGC